MLAKVNSDIKIQVQRISYDKDGGGGQEKVNTNVQMLTIFITSFIITN
jgi:hypothetical protein